jgi:protein SCO1/2
MPIITTRKTEHSGRRRTVFALLFAAVALCLLASGAALWVASAPLAAPVTATIGGPFRLEEGDGKIVTDQDFRGKYLLVYFGYTLCPDACPTTLQSVAVALGALGTKAQELQPLFITVDPKRDTPAAMARYAAAFSPQIIGLSGDAADISAVEKEYKVQAIITKTGSGPDDYAIDHSSVLYLMGPDGRFVALLRADATGPELAQAILHKIS